MELPRNLCQSTNGRNQHTGHGVGRVPLHTHPHNMFVPFAVVSVFVKGSSQMTRSSVLISTPPTFANDASISRVMTCRRLLLPCLRFVRV